MERSMDSDYLCDYFSTVLGEPQSVWSGGGNGAPRHASPPPTPPRESATGDFPSPLRAESPTTTYPIPIDGPSPDEALASLCARCPEAEVDVLSYFLCEAGGSIAAAEAAYQRSRSAEPPAPTLPLPIPLHITPGSAAADSPSWDGWAQGPLPCEDDATAITLGQDHQPGGNPASLNHFTATTNNNNTYNNSTSNNTFYNTGAGSSSHLLSAELGGMELGDPMQVGSPDSPNSGGYLMPFGSHNHYAGNGHGVSRSLRCSPVSAGPVGVRCTTPPRTRRDEASRRAASERFQEVQREITGLKEAAAGCRTRAIDMRRMNRPYEAVQLEKQACALDRQARSMRERAARDVFKTNNQGTVLNMPPIDLHDLTVGAAVSKAAEAVSTAQGFIRSEIYSLVTVPLITGRGAHSADGTPKIRAAVQSWMELNGIPFYLENAGGQLVAELS